MCLGKPFVPERGRQAFELYAFRRVGIYAILQIILMIVGIIILALGEPLFGTKWVYNVIIGAVIIVIFSILPNGKPFFLNLYRMGREYVMFDNANREIYLVTTHCGNFMKPTEKLVCSFSQFRGIAVHHESGHLLLLCRREESLLLKQVGEVLPDSKASVQAVLEEVSLYWFQRNENDAFFGVTYLDFEQGLVAEGNIRIDIHYDYYLKRSDTWKPKNNPLGNQANQRARKQHKEIAMDAKSPDLDDDQYLSAKDKKVDRFQSVKGAEVDVGSDHSDDNQFGVVDYV
mmetsp:Transcript_49453/g.78929  ORF Transcript_49453/g.78929 Transcript_49453/m.78929 type:complete len:287 (-) Transcript_49453:173-1033(-)